MSMSAPSMVDRPFSHPLTENEIQRAVFRNLKDRGAPGVFAFHPKNGGVHQRGKASAINAILGVVPGVPDVIAVKDGQTFALELKAVGGVVSRKQVETMQALQAAGATVALAHGLNAALAKLEAWGLLTGRSA